MLGVAWSSHSQEKDPGLQHFRNEEFGTRRLITRWKNELILVILDHPHFATT